MRYFTDRFRRLTLRLEPEEPLPPKADVVLEVCVESELPYRK